jgi:parallel beta-helix repeat protein
VHTVQVRAGTYSPVTTQEIFPLDLSGLAGLTLQGEGAVVIDAGVTATVFQAEFSRDLVIAGFEITRGVHGIAIQASTNITLRQNQITGHSADGINVGGASTGVVIADNLLADNDRFGLQIFGAGSEATVRHNIMRHNGRHGLVVSAEAHATIADNLSEGNRALGMVVDSNAAATIINNTARQNGGTGFRIQLGSTATLTDNTSTDNGGSHGFFVGGGSTATLTGNTSSNNGFAGVFVENGQNTVTLTGNVLENNGWHGIVSFTDDPAGNTLLLRENTVRQNLGNGISLQRHTTATISGGHITQNALHGIFLGEGATATIGLEDAAELVVRHNFAAGIFVLDDGSFAQINSGRLRVEANRTGTLVGVTDVLVDADADGLDDAGEASRGTDPSEPDTDGDGLLDSFETRYGFDPLDPRDGLSDPDGDGLTNVDEQAEGTDPRHHDTDGDGLHDDEEVRVYETDPTQADTDQGGLTDEEEVRLGTKPREPDSDGDGFRDGVEIAAGSNPLEAQSVPTALVYGINTMRNDVLVLNPDTGQAVVLGSLARDPSLTRGVLSQLFLIAWAPDGRTLYANSFDQISRSDRLHTLEPDTGAILNTVPAGTPPGFLTGLAVDATGAVLATVCCTRLAVPAFLGRLDPVTGVLTRIGPTGFDVLFGMQFTPDFRTLYAITDPQVPPVLVSLDPATGRGTAIAQTDLPTRATALAFTADGRLVVAGHDGNLYELDPVTGASTLIGPTGVEFIGGMTLRVVR